MKTYSCNVDSDDKSCNCAMATLYKDEVSSLVYILQLVASYHKVLESLTSDSSLEVSEELPESVTLGSNYTDLFRG